MDTNLPTDPIVSVNNNPVNPQAQNLKTEKPKRKFHIPKIAILIGFFIILLILMEGGLYYAQSRPFINIIEPLPITASPTSDPTADWLPVTIGTLNFMYPPIYNGNTNPCTNTEFFIDSMDLPEKCPIGDFTPGFSISIIKNKTLDQIKTEFNNNKNVINKSIEEAELEGRAALLTKSVWPSGMDVENHNDWNLYIVDGNDLYVFNSIDLHITPDEQEKYFDQIISTFKFIDSDLLNVIPDSPDNNSTPANPGQTQPAQPIMVACTMEAKLCPDGITSVGRSGPKCEFEKCPGE